MIDTVHILNQATLSIPDTLRLLAIQPITKESTLKITMTYLAPVLSGLIVGIIAAVIAWKNSNRNIRADIYLKSKNDWKNEIMKLFSEIYSELKLKIPERDLRKIRSNISMLRLLLNVTTYPSHRELSSKITELELFLSGEATHIKDDNALEALLATTREKTYTVCKEAWDDIQQTLKIKRKVKK